MAKAKEVTKAGGASSQGVVCSALAVSLTLDPAAKRVLSEDAATGLLDTLRGKPGPCSTD